MVQAKTLFTLAAVGLAYYFYKSSSETVKKPDSPVIKISSGSLKGIISKSRDGRDFYEYLGVPYAQPPQGKLRFEPPQPADKWNGVRDASAYGSICLQADTQSRKVEGLEDCLFLNVFIPKLETKKLLPTLVWIHGGMFVFGSSDLYRPEYFMDHDVVLVTINYRLGSLGFLNTGDEIVRGNMGLKDQNMALKWVQTNIEHFGGDPKQVTIFGESAGGCSVHHQVLSPRSEGLFQKAISQSGTGLGQWTIRTDNVKQVKKFSKLLNCPTEDSESMVECLKATDGIKLMEASLSDYNDVMRDPITVFNPTLEIIKDENAFISELPAETLRKGNFNKVPWMAGVNSDEGILIAAPIVRDSRLTEIKEKYDIHLPHLLWHSEKLDPTGLAKIKDFYFGKNDITNPDTFKAWSNVFGDALFAAPSQLAVQLQSEHSPVFAYYYSYEGQFSLADFIFAFPGKCNPVLEYLYYFTSRWINHKVFGIEPVHYGASHFDEVALQFPLKDTFSISPSDKDYKMSKTMTSAWVAFASAPVSNSQPIKFNGIEWPAVDPKGGKPIKYMHFDVKPKLIDEPNADRHKFWNTLQL